MPTVVVSWLLWRSRLCKLGRFFSVRPASSEILLATVKRAKLMHKLYVEERSSSD